MWFSTSATCRTRDRRGRLVHQHDLGVGQHGARDRHRLALAARHLLDEIARPGLGLQFREELARRGGTCRHSRAPRSARRPGASRGRGRRWPRRSGCRRAPGPGGRSRCRAAAPRPAGAARSRARPCACVPWLGRKLPAIILTSVDLPAPLSPISPTTSPASSDERHVVHGLDGAEMLGDIGELENRHRTSFLLLARSRRGFFPACRGSVSYPNALPSTRVNWHSVTRLPVTTRDVDECRLLILANAREDCDA